MAAAPISRRPVGGHAIHTDMPSRNSVATLYSDDMGFALSPSYSHKAFDFGKHIAGPAPSEEVSPLAENAPATPEGLQGGPAFDVVDPANNTELWRQRSTKSRRNIDFSKLNLDNSNRSTAAPINKQLPPPPERPLPSLPKSIAGSIIRKAVPPRPPQLDFVLPFTLMGQKHSKGKGFGPDDESVSPLSSTQTKAPFARLPTPDYQSRDIQHPANYVVSPVSPNTPPQDELHLTYEIPQKSPSREGFFQILRKDPPTEALKSPGVPSNLSLTSRLHKSPSKQGLSSAIKASESQAVNENKPSGPIASLASPDPQKSPTPLKSSLPPASLTKMKSPFCNLPPRAPPGTVFSAPPLNITHFECYQKHMSMRSSRNTQCPIACQVCEKKDKERRWLCSWCSLRCCDGCMKVLVNSEKDLKVALSAIAN